MSRIIHFEMSADDPERAAEFYKKAFGWQFTKWAGPQEYWLITTGGSERPGIDGGLTRRTGPSGTVNTIGVDSIDAAVTAVQKNGGKIVVPKRAVPTVGWLAYAQDTEGNTFGLMQQDSAAR